jgi:hypothetical protein
VCVLVNLLIQFPGFSNVSFSHKASLVSNNKAEKSHSIGTSFAIALG